MVNAAPQPEQQPPIDARPPHIDAARAWARTVFGAPSSFEQLVTAHAQHDVTVMRLVTEILRRPMRTQRAPMPPGYQPHGQAIAPTAIDPFTVDVQALRMGTEHAEACSGCRGAGGSCTRCGGSGYELVFLTYDEERKTDLKITPGEGVARAYPRLAVSTPLEPGEMADFRELGYAVCPNGPLARGQLPVEEEEVFKANRPRIDPSCERVLRQEYGRWAVVSRTMTYETCGLSGEIVQWGARFEPQTPTPIRRRLLFWAIGTGVALLVGAVLWLLFSVRVAYMATANVLVAATLGVAAIGFSGVVGSALRVWRPSGLGKLRAIDFVLGAVFVLGLAGTAATKIATKPRIAEAREAIQQGNYAQAEKVMAALQATGTSDEDIAGLRDDIEWNEARKAEGDARMAKMEIIAGKKNAHSPDAIAEIREMNVGKVKRLLVAKDSEGAHKAIDALFPASQEPDVLELRARAYDVEFEACQTDGCRYIAGQKAARTAVSPARSSRIADIRSKLIAALFFDDRSMETTLMKLRRLRAAEEKAREISPIVKDDPELLARITDITRKTGELRESVHVLGVSPEMIAELYGATKEVPGGVLVEQGELQAYFPLDAAGVTAGLYLVGGTEAVRKAGLGAQYKLGTFLSKAAGRPVQMPSPPKGDFADVPVSWKEGATSIEARYLDGKLMEVRVADGSPAPPSKTKPPTPKPPPPKSSPVSAHVAAFPGGAIAIDGVLVGRDSVTLKLLPGSHEIQIVNRFLGEKKESFEVTNEKPNHTVVW